MRDDSARLVTYSFSVGARHIPSDYEAEGLGPYTLEKDQDKPSQSNYSSNQPARQHLTLGCKSDSKSGIAEIDRSAGTVKKANNGGR